MNRVNWHDRAQVVAYIVAIALGFGSLFTPSDLRDIAERASVVSFLIGFGISLSQLHSAIATLSREQKELTDKIAVLNELNRAEAVFLDAGLRERSTEHPHILAYLKTGRTLGLEHTQKMVKSFGSMQVCNPIDVQDPRLTEEFLRNLVLAIEELPRGCVWIGTSLVYRPAGWATREIETFATAIREKAKSKQLTVYRIYHFNTGLSDVETIERDLTSGHISVERDHKISVRVIRQGQAIEDVSLLCVPPPGYLRNSKDAPPFLSWDTLRRNGWRVAFCLVWHIRDGCYIDRITVYAGDQFVERYYKSFVDLWGRAVEPRLEDLPPKA